MGDDPHPLKHEWSPIAYKDSRVVREATIARIEKMDAQHFIWGWKSPADFFSLDQYLHYLRNPAVIVVTRDLASIALSSNRREQLPISVGLYESAMFYSKLFDRIRFVPIPKIIVSYESIIKDCGDFITLICQLCRIEASEAQIAAIRSFSSANDRKYRSIDTTKDFNISELDLLADSENTSSKIVPSRLEELVRHSAQILIDVDEAIDVVKAKTSLEGDNFRSRLRGYIGEFEKVINGIALAFVKIPLPITLDLESGDLRGSYILLLTEIQRISFSIDRDLNAITGDYSSSNKSHVNRYQVLSVAENEFMTMMKLRILLQKIMDDYPSK